MAYKHNFPFSFKMLSGIAVKIYEPHVWTSFILFFLGILPGVRSPQRSSTR